MRAPTQQVKNAKAALKQAGFGRSDARVRVEKRYIPKSCGGNGSDYEYGDAEIILLENSDTCIARLFRLLDAGLNVQVHILDDTRSLLTVDHKYPHEGNLKLTDHRIELGDYPGSDDRDARAAWHARYHERRDEGDTAAQRIRKWAEARGLEFEAVQ